MLDQITHLFRLRIILEEGSLRRATERLGLTQPALSRSLAQLEAHFGQPLVERHARGVKATPFGARVLKVSNRIERYWDIATHELTVPAGNEKIRLRIGAGPAWRSGILSPVLVEMQRRFPFLVVEMIPLVFGKALDDLREGKIDVAYGGIISEPFDSANLVSHKLTEVTNQVMARKDHPIFRTATADGTIPSDQLLAYPWIVYTELPIYRETTMHAIYERLGRDPDVRLICQNLLTALTMIQQSDSLCVLPSLAAIDALSPPVVPIPVALHLRKADIGMIYRDELTDWEPMAALVDLCRAHFGTQDLA
ncbi:LysR family transcriptional regulator [Pelagibacterium limicola]|uniref:LysR family transcriptional regulator n=1 Tax=Pelagibacterium limicola TaxID=2791022 RepID=UPI0018AF6832|nr:LysR family transcriptional regulator [Pelagibacterium limicola]